ncbi:cytochrome c biogenesis protein CcmH [Thalassotalea insulae]|uniref:Cytochrome c biogenesis protein CcmH n=1 Tax=Thalassotalea insulae TaxID=2056778 RepID=A0ABQ6GUC4_9GAMM|nr:c-type cytochrome [Thalassotalea insulae]GLX79497.1 cytochrome c biogenesis protein CcmH [Thalassotalea insulae]
MKNKSIFKVLACLAIMSFNSVAFTDTAEIINDCMDCHGNNGISTEPDMPTIAGASATFIESALFAYKDNVRPAQQSKYRFGDISKAPTDMKKIVDQLSAQQISDIATFFAQKPFKAAKQGFNQALVSDGKKVHEIKCQRCHNSGGSDPDDDSGILAGQHSLYLENSMKDYQDGSREMDKKMQQKIDQLNSDEWQALLAYYASQQ